MVGQNGQEEHFTTVLNHISKVPAVSRRPSLALSSSREENSISSSNEDAEVEDMLSGTSKFLQANRHVLPSDFMLHLIAVIHFLFDQVKVVMKAAGSQLSDEVALPWENIYPKGKDGSPMYNPSGKYIVKLYWMGAWRKIVVDDRVPVDSLGQPLLLISSNPHEIWPIILSKALLKIASYSFKDDLECEYGDFDCLAALRGWIPERIPLNALPTDHRQIANILKNYLPKKEKRAVYSRPRGSVMKIASQASLFPSPSSTKSSNSFITLAPPGSPLITKAALSTFVFGCRDSRNPNPNPFTSLPAPCRIVDIQSQGSLNIYQVRPCLSTG